MKEFNLKKDSWHYKLVTFGDPDSKLKLEYGTDICAYIRMVIKSTLLWGFIATLSLIIISGVLHSLYDIALFLFFGKETLENGSVIFLSVLAILSGFFGAVALRAWFEVNRDETKPPSFVTLAYRKFKDKTCSRINFE